MRKFLINVNGNQYEVDLEEITAGTNSNGTTVSQKPVQQRPIVTQEQTPQPPQPVQKKEVAVSEGAELIEAPMPGVILSINVKEGDMVKSGQVLVILEAMKMENEILAPRDGKVASIPVAQGASVSTGDKLVVIE